MDTEKYESIFKKIIEEANEKQTKQIQETINQIKGDITDIKETLALEINKRKEIEEKYNNLQTKYNTLEQKVRKNNIVVFGLNYVKTKSNYQDKQELLDFIRTKLNEYLNIQIELSDINDIYTLGRQEHNNPVIIKFCSYIKKQQILENCRKLKGSGIRISEDLRPEEREVNKCLYIHLKEARQANKSAYIKGNKLYINNKPYSVDDLQHQVEEKSNEVIENPEIDTEDEDFLAEEERGAEETTTPNKEKNVKKKLETNHKSEVKKITKTKGKIVRRKY